MALKTSGQLPRHLCTETLWEKLDTDPWHLRAHDLNEDMLRKLAQLHIEDLEAPGDRYLGHGQHNPMLTNIRLGEVEYVKRAERKRQVS